MKKNKFITAPCCWKCWVENNPDRFPATLKDAEEETCHWCQDQTTSGIYVRTLVIVDDEEESDAV